MSSSPLLDEPTALQTDVPNDSQDSITSPSSSTSSNEPRQKTLLPIPSHASDDSRVLFTSPNEQQLDILDPLPPDLETVDIVVAGKLFMCNGDIYSY